ncbi:hypothetical protein HZS_7457 [Henneguya salminicola]|uniref:protein-serine/threonine phosphatase n=1 Tax=Henneguya salminicola TaxID=69463 RepID=A0A6G3MF37_HENSL|nr:hypothetical protein HZS_7457 [Henneguya salminicola]
MTSSDDGQNEYKNFCFTANLIKTTHIYKDEIVAYLHFLAQKYLHNFMDFDSFKKELVTNILLYQRIIIDKIFKLYENTNPVEVKIITKEFWNSLSFLGDISTIETPLNLQKNDFFVIKVTFKNKRRSQEDRSCTVHDLLLLNNRKNLFHDPILMLGVFDGHGGAHASQYLSIFCPWNVSKEITDLFESKDYSIESLSKCLSRTLKNMNETYMSRYSDMTCGSTVNFCLRYNNCLIFLNIGDSQSYIINKDGTFVNTTPLLHNLSVESERRYSISKGAKISKSLDGCYRLNARFCLSRSFGNIEFHDYLNPEPDIIIHQLNGNEKYVVLGTDGFWEDTNIEIFSAKLSALDSEESSKTCLEDFASDVKSKTADNVTVLVAKI